MCTVVVLDCTFPVFLMFIIIDYDYIRSEILVVKQVAIE